LIFWFAFILPSFLSPFSTFISFSSLS
jgi:hypothetical protein